MRSGQLNPPGRCILAHVTAGTSSPERLSAVLLHGQNQDLGQLAEIADALKADRATYALRAPRVQTDGHAVIGHYWYYGTSLCDPEASTFGDSLFQIERFILDRAEEAPPAFNGFMLVGIDQGGVLALTLAGVWPELIHAVVAIDSCLPALPPAVNLPLKPCSAKPILLITSRDQNLDTATAQALQAQGAAVTVTSSQFSSIAAKVKAWAARLDS
jgi:predicted esterase